MPLIFFDNLDRSLSCKFFLEFVVKTKKVVSFVIFRTYIREKYMYFTQIHNFSFLSTKMQENVILG